MTQHQLTFPSITSINHWSRSVVHIFMDNIVYVFKEGMYYYFTVKGKDYQLSMTSLRDLAEMK